MPGSCRRVVLALSALAFAACSAVTPTRERTDGPYAALPSSPDDALTPRPLTARLTYPSRGATPTLDAFLDRLTAAIERRNWRAVALFMDEGGFGDRVAVLTSGGLSPERAAATAVEGALGLNADTLFAAGTDRSVAPFAGLDRIRTASIRGYALGIETGIYRVEGDVLLDDRRRLGTELFVRSTLNGYRLVVPQG